MQAASKLANSNNSGQLHHQRNTFQLPEINAKPLPIIQIHGKKDLGTGAVPAGWNSQYGRKRGASSALQGGVADGKGDMLKKIEVS